MNLGLGRHFTWLFVLDDVLLQIIITDLLHCFGFLVDCRNNCLLERVTPRYLRPQLEDHQKHYASGQPTKRIPRAQRTHGDPSQGAAHHSLHPHDTKPPSSLPPTPTCSSLPRNCQGQTRHHSPR